MMISRMGKIAALSAVKRSNGEQKYNQKRALRKEVDNQMLQRRRARVQAARSTLGSPESEAQRLLRHAHQYGEAVSKMNRSRIGKPNRMKRINRHPNPEPKRKQEKRSRGENAFRSWKSAFIVVTGRITQNAPAMH